MFALTVVAWVLARQVSRDAILSIRSLMTLRVKRLATALRPRSSERHEP